MPSADFDFLPGRWHIASRKLSDTLDPERDEWLTFDATSGARAILGGIGNIDHFATDGYEGVSLRLYDPDRDVWRFDGGASWKTNWVMELSRLRE